MIATTKVLPPAEELGYHTPIEICRWVAVAAFAAANLLIAALANAEPCSGAVAIGLYVGWIAAPAVGIASLGVISAITTSTTERYAVAGLAVVFLAAWSYALLWSSVGVGIDRIGC